MGFILIAVVLIFVVFYFCKNLISNEAIITTLATICTVTCFVLVLIGVLVSPAGYEQTLVREVKLISSNDASSINCGNQESYVTITTKYIDNDTSYTPIPIYTFHYEVQSSFSSDDVKVYDAETIKSKNVAVIENSSNIAIMQEYIIKAKPSFWGFGLGVSNSKKYVFNVPKSTVYQYEAKD